MICKECSKEFKGKIYPNGLCQSCYNYYRKGGEIHPLPKAGVIEKDNRGYVICHICGRAYCRLGSHIKESHNMSIAQYKEKFGLCNNARTTEDNYSNHMHDLAYKHKMPQRLKEVGVDTRIKLGQTDMRKGKQARLQECLAKRNRNKVEETK